MTKLSKYLKELESIGVIIEDNRDMSMGFWIKKQPFKYANPSYSGDTFFISCTGCHIDSEKALTYMDELHQLSSITKKLNELINDPKTTH